MNPRQILFSKLLPLFNNMIRRTPQDATLEQIRQASIILSKEFNDAMNEYDNDNKQQT